MVLARKPLIASFVFALVGGIAGTASAQSLVPPGVWGYGWGEFPYWLKPTYGYPYEEMTVRPQLPPVVCGYQPTPVYDVKKPHKVIGYSQTYVCGP